MINKNKKITIEFWKYINQEDKERLEDDLLPNLTGNYYLTRRKALEEKRLWQGYTLHKIRLEVNNLE